ncbi:hypothetical protein LguiB_029975 [Lonicera macranthoides]
MTDRASGYSKGYGFVRYTNLQDVEQGLKSPIATNLSYSNEMKLKFSISVTVNPYLALGKKRGLFSQPIDGDSTKWQTVNNHCLLPIPSLNCLSINSSKFNLLLLKVAVAVTVPGPSFFTNAICLALTK